MNSNAATIADFRKGTTPLFFASDGWTNGNPFDCGWVENNATVNNGMLTLKIDKDYSGKYNYTGGEYRTSDHYAYGYYETSMQAIKNPGVISSFFTYTGESEDNPWDEIDIEVLGKDTTKVQFNYYTNGQGNHEFMYNLGFDASEGYHTYGFDWQPDHITWYVDGKEAYTANTNIPKTPGRIMMNTWPGTGVDEWLEHYNGRTPLEAHYQWVTFDPSSKSGQQGGQQQNPWGGQQQNPWGGQQQNPWEQPGGQQQNPQQPASNNGITDYGTPMNSNATAVADFRKGETPLFFASDGWTNGNPFDCGWVKNNATIGNNMLTLKIDKDYSGKYNYTGGEYRTTDHYGFGYYETSMQAIKNPGVVSSFFTYTGESENNPWDEIDIEVLGKDTTKVQFNYYTNGQGNHEFMYDLGFDASQGFHTYGFDWQRDHITWYVDGKPVYTANQNIPQTPGRIMMNTWPGTGVDEWLNHYDGRTPLEAHYQWVTFNKQ
jgi:beta-glucanase (GH16 family)